MVNTQMMEVVDDDAGESEKSQNNSISTGIYRYPIEKASKVALKTISDFLQQHESIKKVVIVCFSQSDYDVYRDNLDMLV